MRRKKILIGSIFILALLLLMPSIPAVQQITIGDKDYNDLIENLKETDFEYIDNFDDTELLNDDVKFPFLYFLINIIYNHRVKRLDRILDIAVEYGFMGFKVIFPFLFLYAIWLGLTSQIWFTFWKFLSGELGLNWDIEP
jgi:hypothetical protein